MTFACASAGSWLRSPDGEPSSGSRPLWRKAAPKTIPACGFSKFAVFNYEWAARAREPQRRLGSDRAASEPPCAKCRSHRVGRLGQAFWRKRENFDAGVGDADRMLELRR